MQLNDWIAANMPQKYRGIYDYESGMGWIYQLNRLLGKLERNGLYNTTKTKERGVEVDNNYWITKPSDMRQLVQIYNPFDTKDKYAWEFINDKIKLPRIVAKNESPDSFTLSEGSTTTIKINDTDATADLWNDYLLVLTDGTYSGDGIIIHDTAEADGGTSILTFRHAQAGTIDSTAGYLTKDYLMLKYKSTFTKMSAYDDEIPIDDKYEGDLLYYCFLSNVTTKQERKENEKKLEEVLNEIKNEQQTPAPDQLRPDPIPWPRRTSESAYCNYQVDEDWDD